MKRILSAIIALTLILALVPLSVFAATDAIVYTEASTNEVYPGDPFTYSISLSGTYDGFSLEFSKEQCGLTITSVTGEAGVYVDERENTWMLSVMGGLNKVGSAKTKLATVSVSVNANAATGSKEIGFTNIAVSNDIGDRATYATELANVVVLSKPVAATGVSLNKESLSLKTGESETLIATVSPDNSTNKVVSWKSDDTSIATVDSNGKVTAVTEGTTTITVTTEDGSFTDTCEVSVVCSHISQTVVGAKDSDCKNQGWDTYAKCDECGQLLAENGTTEIEKIPFRPLSEQHTGGTATCTAQATCTVCGNSYGSLALHSYTAADKKAEALKSAGNCRDYAVYYYSCSACGKVENNDSHTFLGDKIAASHVGGTALVNQSEANHKTQTNGYTGDTKCLGCNEIIAYGQPIPADAHTPSNIWSNDSEYHWKECTVVGCGIVIDGSKAKHSSTEANVATCQKQAVCDVCGVSYGEFASHNYTAEEEKQDALKKPGNCRDNAVYYYSCSICGLVENKDDHTFLGDKVATDHVGGTTLVNPSEANHKAQINGYTGDIKCLGCGEILDYGEPIPAGAHTPASNWSTDGTYHWKVCTVENCGIVIDSAKAKHTSTGAKVATCKTQAKCDICDAAYGSLNASNHVGGTTLVNPSEANHKTQTDGYTGDTKCVGCGEILDYGEPIPAEAHTPANVWSNDEEYHWKECTVVGCGIIIDGSKAKHSSTGVNVATCQKQAVCDVCGVSYGTVADHDWNSSAWEKDASGHWHKCNTAGCTEKNAFDGHTPDHQGGATEEYAIKCTVCQYEIEAQLGHTHVFDKEIAEEQYLASKANCTDPAKYYKSCKCGEKGSETFNSGEALGHTEGTAWEKDATYHWHICTVAGCGVIIDTSKTEHTPDHDGSATEEYAIKCSVCGYIIEAQLNHTHIFDKEVAEEQYLASKANCTEPAKYFKSCKCGEKGTETFVSGEALGHTEGTEWKSDADNHWHECSVAGCGVIIDNSKAAHTPDRDAATETDPIKCSVCGYEITPALGHTHAHGTKWKSDKDNHWNECTCGDKANTAAHSDTNKDGKCDVCEYEVGTVTLDPDNKPEDTNKPSDDIHSPQTGDNSMMWLWMTLLIVSGFGIIATVVMRKKFVR